MSDKLVEFDNVSKRFCRSIKHAMLYGFLDVTKDLLSLTKPSVALRPQEFWSVKDVSFEVARGEVFGLIGANGAGKSTILKMLSGLFRPDNGFIRTKGRVSSLIELTAGFHPMLSGYENMYINAAIFGMDKREIDAKRQDIIDFSELDHAMLSAPVKTYSSGMQARLGFSVAVHSSPDILLIDEVLAVGDIAFQNKCFRKLKEVSQTAAVILVAHNLAIISKVCDHGMYLRDGKVIKKGEISDAMDAYKQSLSQTHFVNISQRVTDNVFLEVELQNDKGNAISAIEYNQAFRIKLKFRTDVDVPKANINLNFFNLETGSFITCARMDLDNWRYPFLAVGVHEIMCVFSKNILFSGHFIVDVSIRNEQNLEFIIKANDILRFYSTPGDTYNIHAVKTPPPVMLEYVWLQKKAH